MIPPSLFSNYKDTYIPIHHIMAYMVSRYVVMKRMMLMPVLLLLLEEEEERIWFLLWVGVNDNRAAIRRYKGHLPWLFVCIVPHRIHVHHDTGVIQGWIAWRHYDQGLKCWLKTIDGVKAEELQLEEPTRTRVIFETVCVLSTWIRGWCWMCVCTTRKRKGTQAACRAFTKLMWQSKCTVSHKEIHAHTATYSFICKIIHVSIDPSLYHYHAWK